MVDPIQSGRNGETRNIIDDEFKVTPWEVEGEIDYNKLIESFGTQKITPDVLEKIKNLIGEVHPMLKLQYFFSHRDFDWILSKYEKGDKFYLYTGRGPSGMIHMGHLLPWIFTKYLQDKFDAKLLFQINEDCCLSKKNGGPFFFYLKFWGENHPLSKPQQKKKNPFCGKSPECG